MDRKAKPATNRSDGVKRAVLHRFDVFLRLLIWPVALFHALHETGGLATNLDALLSVAAVVTVTLLITRAILHRERPRAEYGATLIELILASGVVACTGAGHSLWLALYPWLILDRWHRGRVLVLALAATPLGYLLALVVAGSSSWSYPGIAVQIGLFAVLAAYSLQFGWDGTRHSERRTVEHTGDGNPAGLIRDTALKELDTIARRLKPAKQGEPSEPTTAARSLTRALRLLSDPAVDGESPLVQTHFSLQQLLDTACLDWTLVANLRGHELYGHVDSRLSPQRFGDADKLRDLLDLLLLRACYLSRDDDVLLTFSAAGDTDAPEALGLTLQVGNAGHATADCRQLEGRLRQLAHLLGGFMSIKNEEYRWRFAFHFDIPDVAGQSGSGDGLAGITAHVTGHSPLRRILEDYVVAEGGALSPGPAGANVILLAERSTRPDCERHCRELKERFPRSWVLCQGVTGGLPGGVLLEADGVLPMPLTRGQLVREIRKHPLAGTARRSATPAPERAATPSLPRESCAGILVAEDDPISARVVSRFLESDGYSVRRVADGETALEALKEGAFELALLDMHMPGLSGVEVAQRLREWESAGGGSRTRLVALTASAADEDRRACEAAGMDGFLNKPVDRQVLRQMLEQFGIT